MEANWTTMEGTDTHTDINNGNAVYIMKWNDYVFNQFQTDPDYADFPTLYYRTVNSIENRAWFVWR